MASRLRDIPRNSNQPGRLADWRL